MKIAKDKLEYVVSTIPGTIDVAKLFDSILLMAKIEQAKKEIGQEKFLNEEDIDKEIDP